MFHFFVMPIAHLLLQPSNAHAAGLHILPVGSLLTIKALGLCIPDLDLIRMPCLFVGMAGRLTGGASVKDTLVLVHGETQVLAVH